MPPYGTSCKRWRLPAGESRAAAESLAREIAAFPATCVKNDRLSTFESTSLSLEEGLLNELQRGLTTLQSGESERGAARFVGGEGRHGEFDQEG